MISDTQILRNKFSKHSAEQIRGSSSFVMISMPMVSRSKKIVKTEGLPQPEES